jgi:hypothetical protein
LGNFTEHLVGNFQNKGLRTPTKFNPTPCKNKQNQPNKQGAQSVSGFVPLNNQKKKKKLGFWGDVVFGEKEWKWGNGDKRRAGGGAVVVR